MCGIVGAVAQRPVREILMEGLRRLEYRGYDSAGIAVLNDELQLQRMRSLGKVAQLGARLTEQPIDGRIGIAHTRWATHGEPSERNAHPHASHERIALVHNGIIENYQVLRERLLAKGYVFSSETDTEVAVHLVDDYLQQSGDLFQAVQQACDEFEGAYALAVIAHEQADRVVVARHGSPLLIGIGIGEHFVGSDVQAMIVVTSRFIYLENGDVAAVTLNDVQIVDEQRQPVERPISESRGGAGSAELGDYRHFMLKEIFEQPKAIQDTLSGRLGSNEVLLSSIQGNVSMEQLAAITDIHFIACGTSYHAGLLARYWIESLTDIHCHIEVASEYRYRRQPMRANTLVVTISQSGETADTLAALEKVKEEHSCLSLTICNVPESSLTRLADLALMTVAGPEIGVASTKAFTTQLVALQLLLGLLLQSRGEAERAEQLVNDLYKLSAMTEQILGLDKRIEQLAEHFIEKHHALFLGRGDQYPIALEGALKLKELSYIHAEAYPAGELKHGPLALVDSEMPIVAIAPNTRLLEKLKSNLEEVRARGGELYVFADQMAGLVSEERVHVLELPPVPELIAPIVYTVPLQLLSYHVAVLKGTDVDKPRNLAKSVTVE